MTLSGETLITPVPWIEAFAAHRGYRYEPDAEEGWLRAWEPFRTLRVALRYEHALHGTGEAISITLARMIVSVPTIVDPAQHVEYATWIGIAQDARFTVAAAMSSDRQSVFREDPQLMSLPIARTGDPSFDAIFSVFAAAGADASRAISPSLRRLLLSFQTPLHADIRAGGYIFAPVALGFDPASLAWLDQAMFSFADKGTKY